MPSPDPSLLLRARRPPLAAGVAVAVDRGRRRDPARLRAARDRPRGVARHRLPARRDRGRDAVGSRARHRDARSGSALAFNFFHVEPTGTFTIADGENWVALAVFVVTAIAIGTLADLARSRALDAEQRRREADLAADLSRLAARRDRRGGRAARRAGQLADCGRRALRHARPARRAGRRAPRDVRARHGRRTPSRDAPAARAARAGARERISDRLVPGLEAVLRAALDREAARSARSSRPARCDAATSSRPRSSARSPTTCVRR